MRKGIEVSGLIGRVRRVVVLKYSSLGLPRGESAVHNIDTQTTVAYIAIYNIHSRTELKGGVS